MKQQAETMYLRGLNLFRETLHKYIKTKITYIDNEGKIQEVKTGARTTEPLNRNN